MTTNTEKKEVEIQEKPQNTIVPIEINKELIYHYMNVSGLGAKLNDLEKDYFLTMAIQYRLNPFMREIYCIPYVDWKTKERSLSIITGYEVYLKRAARLNDVGAWRAWTEGTIEQIEKEVPRKRKDGTEYFMKVKTWHGNMIARIELHKKSVQGVFAHEVEFSEYNQENKMWNEKPKTMIKKVVIAQGFRLFYPLEFGGMPYIQEEVPDYSQPQDLKVEKIEYNDTFGGEREDKMDGDGAAAMSAEQVETMFAECKEKMYDAKTRMGLKSVRRSFAGYGYTEAQKDELELLYAARWSELENTREK
jgi:phage recombination protein Bet